MSVTVTLTYRDGDVDQRVSVTKASYEAAWDGVLEQKPAVATALSLRVDRDFG